MNVCCVCGVDGAHINHPHDAFAVLCHKCYAERETEKTARFKPLVISPDDVVYIYGRREGQIGTGNEWCGVSFCDRPSLVSFLEEMASIEKTQSDS